MVIKQLQINERPRERCLKHGAEQLSLRECLSVILGSGPRATGCLGVAEQIVQTASSSEEDLALLQLASEREFGGVFGLGEAGRARLLVCFELAKRFAAARERARPTLQSIERTREPLERQALQRVPWNERIHPREWLGFVPIRSDHRIGSFCLVDRGTRSHVNVDVQQFFKAVLGSFNIAGFFLFHNHPSGLLEPSADDVVLTNELAALSQRLGLHFAGHWIVSGARERRVDQDC